MNQRGGSSVGIRSIAGSLILGSTVGALLSAQTSAGFEAGSGAMRFGSESSTGMLRLAPSLDIRTLHFQLAGNADYADHPDAGTRSSGLIDARLNTRLFGPISGEVQIAGGWSHFSWRSTAAGWLSRANLRVGNETRGIQLGAGRGSAFLADGTWPVDRVEAGAWGNLGTLGLRLWVRRTGLIQPGGPDSSGGGEPLSDTLPGPGNARRSFQDHYTDIDATLNWNHRSIEVEGGLGRRIGKPVASYTAWHLRGVYWLSARLGIVGSVGNFPADVVTGTPNGSYASLAMRINLKPRENRPAHSAFHPIVRPQLGLITTDQGNGHYLLSLLAPGARKVEVMGSFTDWQPQILQPVDGQWWWTSAALASGLHQINMRIDGGPWTVPPGLTAVDDGFGGVVGVFVVQ